MQPRPESRISALEALTSTHTAHLRELASDTAEGLRDLKQDISQLSDSIEASYKQIGDTFLACGDSLASKEDMTVLEGRVRGEIAELKATQDERFNKLEATQDAQGQKLDLILQLLQKKGE